MKLLPESSRRRVRFKYSGKLGLQVFVAGSFNDWNPTVNPLKDSRNNGQYKTVMLVPPGTHEYKFVVDGVWMADPNCLDWARNCYDSINSIIDV